MKNYGLIVLNSTNLRQRIDSIKISTEDPVRGLPGNWYNEAWLAKQPNHVVRRLDMKEDVKLEIPDWIIEYVTSYDLLYHHLHGLCRLLKAENLYV